MIAVTFALPDESTIFLKTISDLKLIRPGALPQYFGKIGNSEIAVIHTGVGEESARNQIQEFLKKQRLQFLISSGFAGGLDPELKIGDLLVAENYSSPILIEAARCYLQAYFGNLTTQQVAAESVISKQELFLKTKALGVDMETSVIAQSCAETSIPFLSLRAISDTAHQALPVPFEAWFDSVSQKARPLALLRYLALHPARIPDFVQFVKGIFKSKKIMGNQLHGLIQFILENGICSQL